MNDPYFLKLRQISFLSRKFPDQWEDLTRNFDALELNELAVWLEKYAKYISLDTSDMFDIYEMIKSNLDNLNNGIPITKDNLKHPKYIQYNVEWNQKYVETGTEYGSVPYLGSDRESIHKQIRFDLYLGDFDYDSSDFETDNRKTDDFDYEIREEQLKKTIHNVLKEHYKLFINKKN